MTEKPKLANGAAQQEIDKIETQFNQFDKEVKSLTLDRMNEAPSLEEEPQTKMSSREQKNAKDIYLKPSKYQSSKEPFNEKWRADYEYAKEYVQFIAEHKELIGETIEIWTKRFPGMNAEFWEVPTNKPVWGPRYLAEQIRSRTHHRLVMKENMVVAHDHAGQYYGTMAADTTIHRMDAYPVTQRRSVFM